MPALPDRIRVAHAGSLAALAKVDAAARVRLAADARRAVTRVKPAARRNGIVVALTDAAGTMEEQLHGGVMLVRGAARGASAESLAVELRALDEDDDLDADDDDIDEDEAAATVASKGLSAAWLAAALLLLRQRGDDDDPGDIGEDALDKIGHRVDGTAITEASTAFNGERLSILGAMPRNGLYKRWDASLDLKTCPECSRLNGVMVPLAHVFPGGAEPGHIHRCCRCCLTLVPARLAQL